MEVNAEAINENGSMDDEYEHQSYGGRGPRPISSYQRGPQRGARGRGGHRGYRGGSNSWSQHDDRDSRSVTERLGDRMGYKGRGRDTRGRRGGQNFRGRGGNYNYNYDRHSRNTDSPSNAPQWYQVMIPHGAKTGKDFIYESINELLDIPFIPTSYREDGQASVFYVELSFSSVEALKAINRRITAPTGFKMQLMVKQQDPPVPKMIEGELLEKLKNTMSNLYDTGSNVLDLSALHKNEGLKPECLPLNRASVMMAVVNIITEFIPELVALNLSSNRLSTLIPLEKLVDSTPNLCGLDLSNNELIRESELDRIKGWKLKELNLAGTAIAKRHSQDFNSYLTTIRKKFPNIIILDGNEAPAPIVFETVDIPEIPVAQSNFFGGSADVQALVSQFVQQYVELFDSDNRASLVDAYHDVVTFSTSFWFYPDTNAQSRFDITNSRNLLKIPSNERNGKRVVYGKQKVIDFLTQSFPKTKHLLETLNVDVVHQSPKMLSFTMTGLYEEPNPTKAHKVTRLFSRNFTTVPQGSGIVIISEQYSFTNASIERRGQMKSAGKQRLEVVSAGPSTSGASSTPVVAPTDDAVRQAMLQRFMAESNMNAHWSTECLEANNWNYEGAGRMYTTLKAEGKIPADAFQM